MKHIFAVLGLTALAACSQPAEKASEPAVTPGTVAIADAWCRPTPNGARAGGCYLTLKAGSDDRLISVSSDLADSAQVHEMKVEDGMMRMSELTGGLPLPAGETVLLKPGSTHIMLMGLKAPLIEGETAAFTLTFEKAGAAPVQAAVRQPPMADDEHAGH